MTFATTVTGANTTFWIVSMVILAFALTSDCVDHLMHLRIVGAPWKILLGGQVIVSMTICVINATLTAGSDSVLSILMNAVGLMVLNDLDDIVGKLFIFFAGIEEEEVPDMCT